MFTEGVRMNQGTLTNSKDNPKVNFLEKLLPDILYGKSQNCHQYVHNSSTDKRYQLKELGKTRTLEEQK
jgi:hypothetical protein